MVIVRRHLDTLYDAGNPGRPRVADLVLFFVVPAAIAAVVASAGVRLGDVAVTSLLTATSVFGALLFNLLLLVYEMVRKERSRADFQGDEQPGAGSTRRRLLREIQENISFAVLLTLAACVVLVIPAVTRREWAVGIATGSRSFFYSCSP